jgi:hypothetical protein
MALLLSSCRAEESRERVERPVAETLFPAQESVFSQEMGLHTLPTGAFALAAVSSVRQLAEAFASTGLLSRLSPAQRAGLEALGAWLGQDLDNGLDSLGIAEDLPLGVAWYGQDDVLVFFFSLRDPDAFQKALLALEEVLAYSKRELRLLSRHEWRYLLVGLRPDARMDSLQHRIEHTERSASLAEDSRFLRAVGAARRAHLAAVFVDVEALRMHAQVLLQQSAEAMAELARAAEQSEEGAAAEQLDDPFSEAFDGLPSMEMDPASLDALLEELRWRSANIDLLYGDFDALVVGFEAFLDGLWLQAAVLRKVEHPQPFWTACREHEGLWSPRMQSWPSEARLVVELDAQASKALLTRVMGWKEPAYIDNALSALGELGGQLAAQHNGKLELGFQRPWNTWTEELPLPELAPQVVLGLQSAEKAEELRRSLFVQFDAGAPEGVLPEPERDSFIIAEGDFLGTRIQIAGDRVILASALVGRDERWSVKCEAARLSAGQEIERNKLFRLGPRLASFDYRWHLAESARLAEYRVAARGQRFFCIQAPAERGPDEQRFCELAKEAERASRAELQARSAAFAELSSSLVGLDLVLRQEGAQLQLYGVLFLDQTDWPSLLSKMLGSLPLPFEAITLQAKAEREEARLMWRSTSRYGQGLLAGLLRRVWGEGSLLARLGWIPFSSLAMPGRFVSPSPPLEAPQ